MTLPPGVGYRHTQVGHAVALVAIGVFVISGAIMLAADAAWVLLLVTALCLAVIVLFGSLTVVVTEEAMTLRFGPGPFGRRWRIDEVASARVVRNPWWIGWGIRLMPGATVYNVSGFDAVEITLVDGRRYRIGTDEPGLLLSAIEARIG